MCLIKPDLKDAVSLGDMKIRVDKRAEWNQIFNESWSRCAISLLHLTCTRGLEAMHDKYAVLVPYVNQRADLDYIIAK